MGECNLCGAESTTRAEIDGVVLDVCKECTKFGIELKQIIITPKRISSNIPELDFIIREGFSATIRKHRQKLNLTQEQLANQLREKSSIVKRIEEGWEPPISTVRKLEKFFNTTLVETIPESNVKEIVKKKLTIEDVVLLK